MRTHLFRVFAVSAVLVAASAGLLTTSEPARAERPGAPGDPVADLSPSLSSLFQQGKERFLHEFTPEEGLGPLYNEKACQTCHGGLSGIPGGPDALGLGSVHNVNHIGFDNGGFFDPMPDFGGPMLERQSVARDGFPSCRMVGQTVPALATIHSVRNTPAVLGFGLIDAIPDSEILAHQNLGIDGIRGVANWGTELETVDNVANPLVPQRRDLGPARVGRFGWKAQTATLEQFSAEPLSAELGISNKFFPQEHTDKGLRLTSHLPNACNTAIPSGCPGRDGSSASVRKQPECLAVNPDDPDAAVALALYHFQALLAPAPRLAQDAEARWGREAFDRTGCGHCHVPEAHTAGEYHLRLVDGSSVRVPALERQTFYPFSDFLLHDMGPELADNHGATVGRVMGRARGNTWRTTPLWGIRLKATYLHDGRTTSVDEAIRAHDGEARIVRDRYEALSDQDRQAILAYLLTL